MTELVKASENGAAEAAGRWAGMYAKDESKAMVHLLRFLFQVRVFRSQEGRLSTSFADDVGSRATLPIQSAI